MEVFQDVESVRLRSRVDGSVGSTTARYLRVNERWLPCLAGVAAFNDGDLNIPMQWEVLPVPTTLIRRDIPAMGHRLEYLPRSWETLHVVLVKSNTAG
uniref:Uncharacterized protein n=1 Tax=Oryza nivara TaxID=4536 RepID=A0A0E0I7K7_ORYNI